jgi:cell division cycle protein 20 (cofactor of APC complex)
MLASGGGNNDGTLRLWNTSTGLPRSVVETRSPITGLAWSEEHREVVSSHGVADKQLVFWNCGRSELLTKAITMCGHEGRVVHMTMSPDKTTVLTAGSDEKLLFWKCFAVDKEKKKRERPKIAFKTRSQIDLPLLIR